MALTVGRDSIGLYAVVDCDRAGCTHHVSGRPGGAMGAYELVCAVADSGAEDGWVYWRGSAYCPEHLPRRLGTTETLADRFDALRVVKRPERAS